MYVQISRNIWPSMPNHKLDTLAHLFDIPLRHHNALDDTMACAKIALKASQVTDTNDIINLATKLKIRVRKLFPGGYQAPKK